jgi:hypothetical protein
MTCQKITLQCPDYSKMRPYPVIRYNASSTQ